MFNNWRTTDNDIVNPPMYVEFYMYNVTNLFDVIIYGDMIEVEVIGPYTYKMRQEKYDIEYNSDWSQVMFATTDEYTFMPDMSVGPESDEFINVDLAFLGGVQLFYATEGKPLEVSQNLLCDIGGDTGKAQACLFGRRNVTESLFSQFSLDVLLSEKLYFGSRPMNPDFQFFERCYSNEDCAVKDTDRYNYGLGGACELTYSNDAEPNSSLWIPYLFCKDPSRTNGSDIRDVLLTGHGHFDDLWKYVKWHGNDSIWYWNVTTDNTTNITSGIEYVAGTSMDLQWNTYLDQSDILTAWDETGLRRVTFQYVFEHEMYGITLWRFRTTDDLYDAQDPHYFGNGYYGFLNATTPSLVVHGSFSPTLVSMAYMAGVDTNYSTTFNCTNCPQIPADMSYDDLNANYGSFFDVQPTLGKVLRGVKRLQINNWIGQDFLFGNDSCAHCKYNKVPETFLPYCIYNFSASFNQTQADLVQDGLDDIDLAHAVRIAVLVLAIIFCVAMAIATFLLVRKWRSLSEVEVIQSSYYQRVN